MICCFYSILSKLRKMERESRRYIFAIFIRIDGVPHTADDIFPQSDLNDNLGWVQTKN